MMPTINDINQAIISGKFTNDQLNSIVMAVTFARNQITKENRGAMVIGSRVKWAGRSGRTEVGVVEKVNRKFVHVRTTTGAWRVPANMLSFAE